MANYCGDYGCKNCEFHKVYYSNDYFSPDDEECDVPKNTRPLFELSDEELDEVYTRVWENGEEWNYNDRPLCPYHKYKEWDYIQ